MLSNLNNKKKTKKRQPQFKQTNKVLKIKYFVIELKL